MAREKIPYRLILDTSDDNYGGSGRTIQARIEICYLGEDGELLSPDWTGYGTTAEQARDAFADLVIRAQSEPKADDGLGWYGWRLEFSRPYSVDLRRAEAMARLLRSLERGLAKLDERFGAVQDFASYAARVADVLGGYPLVQFGRKVSRERDYDGSGYQWGKVDSLRYWLEDAASEKRVSV